MIKRFEKEKSRGVPDSYYSTDRNTECRFQHKLLQVENFLNNRVKTPLNQQQYDALVSFILDKGYRCLQLTGILNDINNGDYDSVPDKIINCDEVGNKRRIVEAKMFYGKRQ